MKKFILLLCLLAAAGAQAQEKMIIKETFESNRLKWDETYEKEYSVGLMDGYLQLKNTKKDHFVYSVTEMPVNAEADFKIISRFTVPKLNDKCKFGIIFNYVDESTFSCFAVSEKRYELFNRIDGEDRRSRHGSIILNAGKNKEVVIELEKKGGKLIFNVDEMEAITITKRIEGTAFGFIAFDDQTLKVEEVVIEQMVEE